MLLLERIVRAELTLHRHLAAGRRAASARMSVTRQARPAERPTISAPATLDREVA